MARAGVFWRAVLASLAVAGVRALFFALKDDYLARDLPGLGARSFCRHLVEGWLACLVPALAAGGLAAAQRRLAGFLVFLASAAAAFAFVALRWPAHPYYQPPLHTTRGQMALALGAVVSLAAALVLWLPRLSGQRAAGIAGLVAVAAASALLATTRSGLSSRPNLILISLDTLRADHLSCYGYTRSATPAIDAFAARALRFTRAYTPQPWTLSAHMTMLTGLYPSEHGVNNARPLERGWPTLPAQLSEAGYATLAVVDRVAYFKPGYGFERGFDYYEQVQDRAEWKIDKALQLLDDNPTRPVFLFLHFYDAHSDFTELPYESHPRDLAAALDGDEAGTWCDPESGCATEFLQGLAMRGEQLAGPELERLVALYDAGIRTLDRHLGFLFAELEHRGFFDSSVILLTADHGEEFFEHGRPLHHQCYEECTAIPFLLFTPQVAPGTSDELVSLVDVAPTLLDFAGLELPATRGISLAPLARGGADRLDRDVVLFEQRGGLRGLRTLEWSLVPTDSAQRLFHMGRDPEQTQDLLDPELAGAPRVLELLEQESASLRTPEEDAGVAPLSEADLEMLRKLGYTDD